MSKDILSIEKQQEVLEMLSSIECILYYATDKAENEELNKIHDCVDGLLNKWHNLTGCILN